MSNPRPSVCDRAYTICTTRPGPCVPDDSLINRHYGQLCLIV
jgi:hypothetical protein